MDQEMVEREEARLMAAINKTGRTSLSRAATKSRPTPSIIPPVVTSPAKPEKIAPSPSAFVRSPSQNFGNPSPSPSASPRAPSSGTTTPTSAPLPSSFVRSPSQNFGAPPSPRVTSTPTTPSSNAPVPSAFVRSPSQNFGAPLTSPRTPTQSTNAYTPTPSAYVRSPAQNFGSPSSAIPRSTSSGTVNTQAQSGLYKSPSNPAVSGSVKSPHGYTGYLPGMNFNSPAKYSPRASPQTTPTSSQPPSRSVSENYVPASQQPQQPQQPQQSESTMTQSMQQALQELESLEAATKQHTNTAPVTPRAETNELDRLISDLQNASVSPAAAGRPTYGSAYADSAPAHTSASAHTPAPAPVSESSSSVENRTSASGARPYGATFGALLDHIEKEEQKQSPSEPAPAPSSRIENRKLSIPSRPQHEDSSDSLLEHALVNQAPAQSSLREGSSAQENRVELTEEAAPEVLPTFQAAYQSINTYLGEPNQTTPATTSSSVASSATSTTHTIEAPATSSAPVTTSHISSQSTSTSNTFTPAPTTYQSSSSSSSSASSTHHTADPSLSVLESTSPSIAPINESSREIRTALENYQTDSICGSCNQTIQGRHLFAIDKHWHNEHFQCTSCRAPITQYAANSEQPYCGPCYTKNFLAPKCNACGDFIVHELVEAFGGQYHVSCFVCSECRNRFPNGEYVESKITKGKVYCQPCFYKVEGKKCNACSEPITEAAFTEILGKTLHQKCFKCYGCQKPFTSMECYPINNDPFCFECATARSEQQ